MDYRKINQFHVSFIYEILGTHFGIKVPLFGPECPLASYYSVETKALAQKLEKINPIFKNLVFGNFDTINDFVYNNATLINEYLRLCGDLKQCHSQKILMRLYDISVINLIASTISIIIPVFCLATGLMILNSIPFYFFAAGVVFGYNTWVSCKIAKKLNLR